jgi:hypothetical protein
VFTTILRRIFRTVVFFFAAYAFVFMPLGDKTALEHVLAIVRTPQAQKAGSELKTGAERLVKKLREKAQSEEFETDVAEVPRRHRERRLRQSDPDQSDPDAKRPLAGTAPAAPSALPREP